MAGEWRIATVAELQGDSILLVEDGNHGEYRPRPDEFADRGVAFIRAADMDAGRVLFESAAKINERARQRITKGIGAAGDVLLSHKGTVGKVALVPASAPPFVCSPQTTFWRTRNEALLDRRYLYSFLRSPGFHEQLASRAAETDMAPYVSLTSQRGLSVALPPIDIQRVIGHIVGSLDEKIELNQQMSEALETTARVLFKSWFVDFEPVRAKAQRRHPDLRLSLESLFPSRFVQTGHGEVPEGWTCAGVGSWVESVSGGTPSKGDPKFWGGDIPWISPKVMTAIHADEADEHVTRPAIGNGTRLVPRGSVLVMVRGMGLHECVRISQTRREVAFNQDVKALVPRNIEPSLLLFALLELQEDLLARVESSGHGTGRLSTDVLLDRPITMPPRAQQKGLASVFDALNARIACARDQNRALTALRDALLPKLISGELRVPDAEHVVARAV